MAKRVLLVCVMLAISVQISQTQARKSHHLEKIEEIARERRQEIEEREERREINSYGPYGWRRKRSLKDARPDVRKEDANNFIGYQM
ncbi:hypothetical protein ABFA07_000754 [Porites harrisoni]